MRRADIVTLFDHSYWATYQVLSTAARLSVEQFVASSTVTTRSLRGTLVHALDVEWSWRLRLRGADGASSERELTEDDYPTVRALAEHWRRDEAEMRAWLAELDDTTLAERVDLGGRDRFPLWYFLMHILTHSSQQRSDAAVLLTRLGQSPGDLDFLNYADWAAERQGQA